MLLWRVRVWRILIAISSLSLLTVSGSWFSFCSSSLMATRTSSSSCSSWASLALSRLISWSIWAGASTRVSIYLFSSATSCRPVSLCSILLCWADLSARRSCACKIWGWWPSMKATGMMSDWSSGVNWPLIAWKMLRIGPASWTNSAISLSSKANISCSRSFTSSVKDVSIDCWADVLEELTSSPARKSSTSKEKRLSGGESWAYKVKHRVRNKSFKIDIKNQRKGKILVSTGPLVEPKR